jgi:histidine phosphotransfer protein HptB
MSQVIQSGEPLFSRLGGDPDLGELVSQFVEEMPRRTATMVEYFRAGDLDGLRRTAHQLKGAAGSYGFDPLSPAAARLENAIRTGDAIDQVQAALEELVDLCGRARPGAPE